MKIEQQLYGYRDGHRLLASSAELDETLVWELVRATDRPSVPETELQEGITFGFAVSQELYALCRTWAANEVSRPGAVWTHVLLINPKFEPPGDFFGLLHEADTPRLESFRTSIEFKNHPQIEQNDSLSNEAAQLLLLLASKPQSGLRALSKLPPIQVFLNAQEHWKKIFSGRSFSTSAGKKNVVLDRKSIIISSSESNDWHAHDQPYLQLETPRLPSKRIARAWQLLDHDSDFLRRWLKISRSSFRESPSNLKLALEILLLGKAELDDNKLILRVLDSSLASRDEVILKFVLGRPTEFGVGPDPWVSALFLLGQQDWDRWSELIWPENVGEAAASAPIDRLADRLLHLADGPEVRVALSVLSESITPSEFEELFDHSLDAASVLIECNPDLLYTLPQAQRARRRFASNIGRNAEERSLELELSMFSWFPVLWRGVFADRIRRTYRDKVIINYTLRCINEGKWGQVGSEVKEFLLETPKLLDALLHPNPTRRSVAVAIDEFDAGEVRTRIFSLVEDKGVRVGKVADALVDFYGASNSIALFVGGPTEVSAELLARIADARWRMSDKGDVLEIIQEELSNYSSGDLESVPIRDEALRKALEKDRRKNTKQAYSH